jgi:hypothetical protein
MPRVYGAPSEDAGARLPGLSAFHQETPRKRRDDRSVRLGGTDGNETLTGTTAFVLTVLLIAEGVTIIRMRGLVGAHMFIGLALIPPVGLKLASTGYRFARYYTNARAYREKGAPPWPLRLAAPVLILATISVLATGVILLADGHKTGALLEIHKVSFIVWGVMFALHFLWHLPAMLRAVTRTRAVAGAGWRAGLLVAAAGGGVALCLALATSVDAWHP